MSDSMDDIMRRGMNTLADNIVNPKCDECGVSVTPRNPLMGPHLCAGCEQRNAIILRREMADMRSQERPDRRVHVVRLPENLR
jgi:hypothetical protein